MRQPQHGVVHQLVKEDPQPQVLLGQAPLAPEGVEVGGDDDQLVGERAGEGHVVLPEGSLCHVPHHQPRLHAEEHGPEQLADAAEELGAGVGLDALLFAAGQRQGRRQAFEQGSVGLQPSLRPFSTTHGPHLQHASGRRRRQAGGIRHIELGDTRQLLELHADEGVDVGLGLAFGGEQHRDLAGHVPAHGALLAEQPGEVAEDRELLEGVPGWTGVAHWCTIPSDERVRTTSPQGAPMSNSPLRGEQALSHWLARLRPLTGAW